MNCPNCKKEITPDSFFCQWCSDFIPSPQLGRKSGVFARFLAIMVEPLIGLFLWVVPAGLLAAILPGAGLVLIVIFPIFYFIYWLSLYRQGMTPGKKLFGLQVVKHQTGHVPGFGTMFLRDISRIVSGFFFGLGYFWALFDKNGQAWHDKIAGTVVIKKRKQAGLPMIAAPALADAAPVTAPTLPPRTNNQIYLYRNEQNQGPYTEKQLREMVDAGTADPADMAWYEGLGEWSMLNTIIPPGEPMRSLPAPLQSPAGYPAEGSRRPFAILAFAVCGVFLVLIAVGFAASRIMRSMAAREARPAPAVATPLVAASGNPSPVAAVTANNAGVPIVRANPAYGKIVVIPATQSPDGRYALGWSVRDEPGSPPADWNLYNTDYMAFLRAYITDEKVDDLVVDLNSGRPIATLPFKYPYYQDKNHGDLSVVWGQETNGVRFAMVENGGKWSPLDLRLLQIDANGVVQADVLQGLTQRIQQYVAQQLPVASQGGEKNYAVDFGISKWKQSEGGNFFLDANTLHLAFSAEVPKSTSDPAYPGVVVIRMQPGNMPGDSPKADVVLVQPSTPVNPAPNNIAAAPPVNPAPEQPVAQATPNTPIAQANYEEINRQSGAASISTQPQSNAFISAQRDNAMNALQAFFQQMWQHGASNDASVWASDFAPESRYCYKDDGPASRDFIQQDRAKAINRWPERHYQLLGTAQLNVSADAASATIDYRFAYSYNGYGKIAQGTCHVSLALQPVNGRWMITQYNETVSRR